MKRLYVLLLFICAAVTANAQVGMGGGSGIVGRISGTVVDSVTKQPLSYATISVYYSGGKTPVNGVLTDDKGQFKLDNVKPGNYKIGISFIGYPTKFIDPVTTTPGKPDFSMGEVVVSPGAKALAEVQVTGQAALIENKIDKIVFNAEKDITSAGGNATDVLRKVPLVAVDINGNVSLRGDQNVRVLINGKPSGALASNLADVLRTIPADQIKNVEVITAPSAKYDAEGSGGIINIVTKTKNASGLSGVISGGVGTRQNNGNVNLNYKKNRLSLTTNLGTNLAWPQTSTVDFQSTTGDVVRKQYSESDTKRGGLRGSINGSYDFNDKDAVTTTFSPNYGRFSTDGNSTASNSAYANPDYTTQNLNKVKFTGFDWNADYTHKFAKKDEELSFAGQWSHASVTSDYRSLFFGVPNTTQFANQMGNNDGTNDEYTIQTDYALPVTDKFKIEVGGKGIFRNINSNYDVFKQIGNQGDFLPNDTASNLYDYTQNVYAGYSVLTFALPKNYSLQVGGRVESTHITGDPQNATQQSLTPFSQTYTNFIPSFILSKTIKGTQTLKLTYSKRIQRPSLQYLNPFINKANPDNQTQGTPTLSPEVTQSVELGYNAFIKSSMVNFSVYYKHTNNLIEAISSAYEDLDLGRTVTRTNYYNIGKNNSVGASFFGSINPVKPLTIRGSINGFTYSPSGFSQALGSSNGTYFQYNAFLSGQIVFSKTLTGEMFGIFNSPRRTIQGKNPAFNLFGFGVKKEVIAKKLSIGVNALSPFQKYLKFDQEVSSPGFSQVQKIRYPLQSFGVTFSYSFGKINYSQPKKSGINNDDLKGGDQGGMGGMGGGSGTGTGTGGPR